MKPDQPSPAALRLQLDGAALARLRELDPDGSQGTVPLIMRTFEASLLRLLTQARDAAQRGDVEALAAVAHTLKSSAASVGALDLSAVCAGIEHDVLVAEPVDSVARVRQLSAEAERALAAVRAMLQS